MLKVNLVLRRIQAHSKFESLYLNSGLKREQPTTPSVSRLQEYSVVYALELFLGY